MPGVFKMAWDGEDSNIARAMLSRYTDEQIARYIVGPHHTEDDLTRIARIRKSPRKRS